MHTYAPLMVRPSRRTRRGCICTHVSLVAVSLPEAVFTVQLQLQQRSFCNCMPANIHQFPYEYGGTCVSSLCSESVAYGASSNGIIEGSCDS